MTIKLWENNKTPTGQKMFLGVWGDGYYGDNGIDMTCEHRQLFICIEEYNKCTDRSNHTISFYNLCPCFETRVTHYHCSDCKKRLERKQIHRIREKNIYHQGKDCQFYI